MLMYRRTSILESTAQTLANTVNCVGVMGKGLARSFKEREPEMFLAYKRICSQGLLQPGKLWLWQGYPNWVLNFPTKKHWRHPSRLEWIEAGLQKFADSYADRGITEISFPQLGCGNGGLDWEDVRPVMEHYLGKLNISVYIHDYTVDLGLPEHLDHISKLLAAEGSRVSSFSEFLQGLRRVTELHEGRPIDGLEAHLRFAATMDEDDNLHISFDKEAVEIEADALRATWLGLSKGVVTGDKAGWSSAIGGEALLTMLAMLPSIRTIEVQKPNKAPERAIELRPGNFEGSAVSNRNSQLMLSWA